MVHSRKIKVPRDWVLDTEKDYIAFSEGNYYKVNNALVYRIPKKEVVLRNTWSGEEKVLAKNVSKEKALKLMNDYAKIDFDRLR